MGRRLRRRHPDPAVRLPAPGEPVTGGEVVSGVNIVFATGAGSAPVDYVWNGWGYARSQSGTPHVDALGQQVTPENVIVSFTPYAESDVTDSFGVPIREAQTVGSGDAWIFTGGQLVRASWHKPSLEAPQYLDAAGQPVRLTPGAPGWRCPSRVRPPLAVADLASLTSEAVT